jgi:hypothetical protein
MGFRFRRTFKVAPGVRLNLRKSGVSTSVGRRGLWFTIGPRGTRSTVGLPGTGLSYSEQSTNRGSSGGLLTVLVIVGLLIAAIALFG